MAVSAATTEERKGWCARARWKVLIGLLWIWGHGTPATPSVAPRGQRQARRPSHDPYCRANARRGQPPAERRSGYLVRLRATRLPEPCVSGDTRFVRKPQPVRSLIANVPATGPP